MNALEQAAGQRMRIIRSTSIKHRKAYAQHFTPPETAVLAARLFSDISEPIECLDLGAGTGILAVALLERYGSIIRRVDAVELDPVLSEVFDRIIRKTVKGITIIGDALTETPNRQYDRIILNPPYKKMAANDSRQHLLPIKSANLYTAFLATALSRLATNGEVVAIIPRSWMNGDYYKPFRKWALCNYSLDAIHVYGSRTEIFKDTSVLQEIMLVRFSNRPQAKMVSVTQSNNKADAIDFAEYRVDDLVDSSDNTIRIAPEEKKAGNTIASIGICPSTGKVIDFRSRDLISCNKPKNTESYPLIYPGNFHTGRFRHPIKSDKAQWFNPVSERDRKQVLQPGFYVVVKRFSSKEEIKRVVSHPLWLKEPAALENDMNYLHEGTSRHTVSLRSKNLSQGLALWLNSSYIDKWLRDLSGTTEVNASDIKRMPSPTITQLEDLGTHWKSEFEQSEIDTLCKAVLPQFY